MSQSVLDIVSNLSGPMSDWVSHMVYDRDSRSGCSLREANSISCVIQAFLFAVVLTTRSLWYFRDFYNRFFEGSAHNFLNSFIPIESSSGHAFDCRQIHEQLHDDFDSSSEFSQDSDIDIFDRIDRDSKISGPDLRDSFSNFDEGEVENVGGDGGGNDGRGGYNDDDDNEDWAPWDENSDNFYMILFRATSAYKSPRSRQMPVSPDEFLCYIWMLKK
jgi:hypothetical protein